ncbi:MAG: hypothetical protein C0618_03640 [Desulfuromonas sp.]|nr:MAG: hypothetical protein C0618_03640 [Desulfuromonas sp.]
MKKVTFIFMLVAVAMFWGTSAFAVSGQCSGCHSMHNTDGDGNDLAGGPNETLLLSDCVTCHTDGTAGAPIVNSTTAPGTVGPGGNFYWVGTDETTGHNVAGVDVQDTALLNTPPGGGALGGQLTCAGVTGCHGDRTDAVSDMSAISGAHHGNVLLGTANQPTGGAAAGDSYRFLEGIKGIEDDDYQTETAVDYNKYYGVDGTADAQTISALCASCHSNFHGTANTQSAGAWVRHPTDFDMSGLGGDFAAYSAYRTDIPVASSDMTSATIADPQTAGNAIVNCLSCHYAHGSGQSDMLRFDYTTMLAGGGASTDGCFACHSTKDQ